MAKGGSGIGTIVGLGVAGFGVWWLGGTMGWWGGTTVTAAPPTGGGILPASTPMPTTPTPAATIKMNGSPYSTINDALKASFTINGATQNIAVIPNGGAYNDSGQEITSTLAAIGVTPAQLYALMQASYVAPAALAATPAAPPAIAPIGSGSTSGAAAALAAHLRNIQRGGVALTGGMRGLGTTMVRANRGNYRRAS